MIRFIQEDIADVKADVIVNAANGIGYMGGFIGKHIKCAGVAESLHYKTKGVLEKRAKKEVRKTKPKLGQVYITEAEPLEAKWIFHAVTMKYPGTWSNLKTIEECVKNIIKEAKLKQVKTIAIPGLGTGTGGLNLSDVLNIYKHYFEKETELTIILVDPTGKMGKLYEEL